MGSRDEAHRLYQKQLMVSYVFKLCNCLFFFPKRSLFVQVSFVIPFVKNSQLGIVTFISLYSLSASPSIATNLPPPQTLPILHLPTAGVCPFWLKARPQKYLLTFSSVTLLARSNEPLIRTISASIRSWGLSENSPLQGVHICCNKRRSKSFVSRYNTCHLPVNNAGNVQLLVRRVVWSPLSSTCFK